ncbi:putative DNA binding domain-containing protein [Clostridium sardiniense]|uniref:DNA binding domain-containing protein n=1 Tax=Clostridium sardiniense TaxID=29369 RepID=A0ABS7KT25_CLOSR|nr:RNA-binding domain-containing protein [Clostridium sardiniense]MBY0753968.1 putative DNA binding domain-containing protein [Clostridium sardiniense]MDQ0459516.1 putative HTH transcriptional regulator [Clostridium sardiniense]
MDRKKLNSLIKREEGQKLDFKLKLDLLTDNGKKEFAKDICAIANCNGGRGYIVVGVRDKSKMIEGIKEEDMFTEEKVQQIISSRCDPPIPIIVDFLKVDSKTVAIITICDGQQRPYQIKEHGIFYTRRGSITDVMRRSELIAAFEDNMELTVETTSVIRSNINMLDENLLKLYFRQKGIELNKDNKEFLLQSAGIINFVDRLNGYRCTYGGLLVFSEVNNLCIPNNMIKIVNKSKNQSKRNKGNNKCDSSDIRIVQGSLLTMVDKAEKEINSIMPSNYPSCTIVEAIKNAILYREYTEINKIIEVVITDKSVAITSPGDFIDKTVDFNKLSCSKRNMWIYEKLISLDKQKRFLNDGNGLSRIKSAFKGKNRVRFINSKSQNSFKVILPGTF